jgi:hypothetical protein
LLDVPSGSGGALGTGGGDEDVGVFVAAFVVDDGGAVMGRSDWFRGRKKERIDDCWDGAMVMWDR